MMFSLYKIVVKLIVVTEDNKILLLLLLLLMPRKWVMSLVQCTCKKHVLHISTNVQLFVL